MNQSLTIQDYDKDPLMCWLLQEVRDELFNSNPNEKSNPRDAAMDVDLAQSDKKVTP